MTPDMRVPLTQGLSADDSMAKRCFPRCIGFILHARCGHGILQLLASFSLHFAACAAGRSTTAEPSNLGSDGRAD